MEYCGNQAIVLECEGVNFKNLQNGAPVFPTSWLPGYCYLNKVEWNLNRSKDDSFVEWVAKNNSRNNGECHKIHEICLINCFVFVIILV